MAYLKQVNSSDGRVRVDSSTGKTIMATDEDACCCADTIDKPGYVIYARKCCSGEVTNIYLKLDELPTVPYFTTDWHAIDNDPSYCFFFNGGDVDDAILATEVGAFDVDFLVDEADYEEVDCEDSECGCRCCRDWRDDPDDPDVGERGGTGTTASGTPSGGPIWYQFSGVSFCSRLFECHDWETGLGEERSWQVQPFTMPSGPYTGAFDGSTEIDFGCDDPVIPEIYYDVKNYNGHGCSGSPTSTETHRLLVWPGVITMQTTWSVPDPDCYSSTAAYIFWGGNPAVGTVGGDVTSDCSDETTWNNAIVGCDCGDNNAAIGYGQGYGGTCVVGPCCAPEEGI